MRFFIPVLVFICLVLPTAVSAQGLVQCGNPGQPACNSCYAVSMVNSVINWLIGFLSVIAVIGIVIAGFKLVVSAGDPSAMQSAKNMFTSIVIGILLILAAWLIVDTVMKGLTGKGLEVMTSISCTAPATASPAQNPGTNKSGTNTSVAPTGNQVSLNSQGVNVANNYVGINGPGRTDLVDATAAEKALWMQQEGQRLYGVVPFQVTAATTDNVGHSVGSQHYNGVAIDFDPINGVTNAQVKSLADQAGFAYVLDEGSHVHADLVAR